MTQDQLLELSMLSDDPKEQQYADAYIDAMDEMYSHTGKEFDQLSPQEQFIWINACHDLARAHMIFKSI